MQTLNANKVLLMGSIVNNECASLFFNQQFSYLVLFFEVQMPKAREKKTQHS